MIRNGVTFIGEKTYHSYDDFELLLENVEITPPKPKIYTIDIPGRNGLLDVTGALTESVVYDNRTITLSYKVKKDMNIKFLTLYSKVQSALHGKEMNIILDDDKGYYYTGRVGVESFKSSKNIASIVIACNVDPFKTPIRGAGEDWLWDPFSFINGVIYPNIINVEGSINVVLPCEGLEVNPRFTVLTSEDMVIIYNGRAFTLKAESTTIINSLLLKSGETTVNITGNGKVKISYEGGSL